MADLSGSHYDLSNNYYVNKIANDNNIAILDTSVNQLEGTTATNTSDISTLNTNLTTKAPIASPSFTGVPTAPTAGSTTNTTQIATTAFVQSTVANLVDSAPDALNTLNELAAAIGDDANYATTITNSLSSKQNILSEGAFVDGDKTKLDGIAATAQVNVKSNWNQTDSSHDAFIQNKPTIPSNTNELTNGAAFITASSSDTLTNKTWNGTAIGTTYGGTGLTSYTTGDVLYASASNTLAKLTAGTDGHVLKLSSGVPTWASESVTSSIWSTNGNKIYYSTDNVGIGNSNPSKTLDVTGDINFTGTLYQNGSAFSSGMTASSSDTLTNKTIDADGTGNSITNIDNDNIKASAGIVYSKLSIADADLTIAKTDGLQSALDAKQATLTFGKSSGNALKSEEALTTDDVLLMGTSDVKGRTFAELKSDLTLNNVENTALSTWTGSTNITTLGTIATGVWNGTTIGTAYGGTGLTSIGSAEQVLKVNSGGTALEWGSVTSGVWTQSGNDVYYNSGNVGVGTSTPGVSFEVVGDISGTNIKGVWAGDTIASTKGGTGLTSYTTGDILYASASNTLAKLAAGTDGHVLKLSSGVPTWAAESGGGGGGGGSSSTVTLASANDASANYYLPFSNQQTGDSSLYTDSSLYYDPSNNVLHVPSINIAGTGNAASVLTSGDQTIGGKKTFTDDIFVNGSLVIGGALESYTIVNHTISDKVMELANGSTGSATGDSGIVIERGDDTNVFMGWDESEDKFIMGTTTATGTSSGDLSITKGTLIADLQGNADTVTNGLYTTSGIASLSDVPTIGGVGTVLRVGSGSLLEWATLSGGSSQWTTSGLNIYYTDGNVGIGTQSPSTKLEVNEDDVKITCTAGKGLHLYGSSASANWKLLPSTGVTTKMFRIYDNDNTADRLVINGSGNVGIGNYNPGHKLDVTGDGKFSGNVFVETTGAGTGTDTSSQLRIQDDEGSNKQFLKLGVNSSSNYGYIQTTEENVAHNKLAINPLGGNVGIGNTNPSKTLDVTGDINFTGTLYQAGVEFSSGGDGAGSNALSGAYLTLSSNNQDMNDATRDYTWNGRGTGTYLNPTSGNATDFTAVKAGYYNIHVFLWCSDGTANERSRVYGFLLVRNSGNAELSRAYFGSSYYRDDNNAYDDLTVTGTTVIYLNVGDKFRVRTIRTFSQDGNDDNPANQNNSRLYCQYMGIA